MPTKGETWQRDFNLFPKKETKEIDHRRVLVQFLFSYPTHCTDMPGEAVVTGYYRYTDIWFEWYALNCIPSRLH